jgi:glutamate-ammonia-ligase adenylyltransferase
LRPDPGSTPAAISLIAAETYYEGFGQNWERAAMIKARQMAGDPVSGQAFLRSLRPFIWRKHLDFAAIRDIHSIKRQINAHKGGGKIAVAGHNIKLGRGGIREIEFFAQTQQLIWGGREPMLRVARTCDALAALAEAGHVQPAAAEELTTAYHFLRRLEHRLQMTDDKQTQTLPDDGEKLTALAVFMGYAGQDDFAAALTATLRSVETHYAALFEDSPPLAPAGNLVFTGGEDDPETLTTITAMGFTNAAGVSHQIRGWHHGRVRATRSTRARELLTELTPTLLDALARTAEPDAAFLRFDAFLSSLPAGVPLFALFHANPVLLDLVAEIMGDAPRLAEHLARNPTLLDGVLTQGFLDPPESAELLAVDLNRALDQAGGDIQEMLDAARRWANEQKFRVGVQTLRNMLEPAQAAGHLSDIADATLLALQPRVEAEFARQHGRFPGPGGALVALGKMGSREMTASSDLDLILVYDTSIDLEQSDGPKPLAPSTYYARLTQRIIAALTAQTGQGSLYAVDMRLRPSGHSGPIATSLQSFAQYHETMAWTWEHLALTRARVVTGGQVMGDAIRAVIDQTLRRQRDPDQLLVDVAEMRERMAREHKADSPWEVKHRRGGLVDIEFIAQYLQLRHAHDHPEILQTSTAKALEVAASLGLLSAADAELLLDALRLWSAVQQVLRQTVEGSFAAEQAPGRLKDVLVRATACTHFDGLTQAMAERAGQVFALFTRLIDDPARPLRAALAAEKDTPP